MIKKVSSWFYTIPVVLILLAIALPTIVFASVDDYGFDTTDTIQSSQQTLGLKDGKVVFNFEEEGMHTISRIYNIPYNETDYWYPETKYIFTVENIETKQQADYSLSYFGSYDYNGNTACKLLDIFIETPGKYTITILYDNKKPVDASFIIAKDTFRVSDISDDDALLVGIGVVLVLPFAFFLFIAAIVSTVVISNKRNKYQMQQYYAQYPYAYYPQHPYPQYAAYPQYPQYPQYQPQQPIQAPQQINTQAQTTPYPPYQTPDIQQLQQPSDEV